MLADRRSCYCRRNEYTPSCAFPRALVPATSVPIKLASTIVASRRARSTPFWPLAEMTLRAAADGPPIGHCAVSMTIPLAPLPSAIVPVASTPI